MKYIRTENGIYETITQNLYKNDDLLYIDGYNLERVINQADTIEELCDEFVLFSYDREIKPSISGVQFPLQKYVEIHEDYEIYGAVWTNKGLIYVAKMNEKGELELL